MKADKKAVAGNIVGWANKIGEGVDDLPPEDLREVLRLIVDEIVIDRSNHVTITMGIPTDELVSIEKEASPCHGHRNLLKGQKGLWIPAGARKVGEGSRGSSNANAMVQSASASFPI